MGGEAWTVQEWEHFFEGFPKTATAAQLKALDSRFKFTGSPNAIISRMSACRSASNSFEQSAYINEAPPHVARPTMLHPAC